MSLRSATFARAAMPALPAAIALLTLLAVAAPAWSQSRFPPPEFESGYTQPTTTTPPGRANWADYCDLAVLAGALALASVAAVWVRRRWLIVLIGVAALAYLGFYRQGCICPIGAIQNVAMAVFGTGGYVIPLTVVGFFLLPLATALFFGRSFCAAVCPLGVTQDLLALKPIRVPMWLEHALGLLAWVYLGAAVLLAVTGSAMIICRYDPFVSIFRLVPLGKIFEGLARRDPELNPAALSGRLDVLILTASFLLVGVFIARPYCRYFCPYGALLGLLSRFSVKRVRITPGECIQCRLCEDSCPVNAIRTPTPDAPARQLLAGKGSLAATLVLLPVLTVAGGALGGMLGSTMARLHPTVALADRVRMENAGAVEGTTDASEAFRATGKSAQSLYAEAGEVESRFTGIIRLAGAGLGGAHLFGAFVGLVVGLKLVGLSVRRRRGDYEPDDASCIACGRCFATCPVEQAKRTGIPLDITQYPHPT
jgi:NosR/NirI family nitrous oxide reductase transcriptional regulator